MYGSLVCRIAIKTYNPREYTPRGAGIDPSEGFDAAFLPWLLAILGALGALGVQFAAESPGLLH